MFNLENAIQTWKRSLKQSPAFEEGQIKEMETHLRDHIDHLVVEGLPEEEAFRRAAEKFGAPEELEDEVYKTKTTKPDATPPWKQQSWIPAMLPNHLKVAFRNYGRTKGYTFINVVGLAIGLACTLLIFLHVQNEFSYDTFHEKSERIYRVTQHVSSEDQEEDNAGVQLLVGSLLQDKYPEVESIVRFWRDFSPLVNAESPVVKYEDNQFRETKFYYADSTIFDVFDFEFLQGNPSTAFDNPYSVVLTKTTAEKYFGEENPVGKTITITDSNTDLEVTGVLEDIPGNSHIQFDLLSPFHLLEQVWLQRNGVPHITGSLWTWTNTWVYVLLSDENAAGSFQQKLPEFVQQNYPEEFKSSRSLHLQPITDIHLYSNMGGEMQPNGNIRNVYIFLAAGIFILLLACINFINLSTARSISRAKEVGVKKVIGASRSELVRQFLFESLLLTVISAGVAILLAQLWSPLFRELVSSNVSYSVFSFEALTLTAGLTILVGVTAGLYPALFLSRFSPSKVLKGDYSFAGISRSKRLRKILVVTQFSVSVILLTATVVVYSQIDYLLEKDLGFDTEQVVVVNVGILKSRPDRNTTFMDKLLQREDILEATTTESVPGRFAYDYYLRPEGRSPDNPQSYAYMVTDTYFTDVFDLEFLRGEEATKNANTRRFVINETAAEVLGWEDPIGKTIYRDQNGEVAWQGEITGIIKDFHFRSLHSQIEPLILGITPGFRNFRMSYGYNLFKIKSNDVAETLAYMRQTWDEIVPGQEFDYFFLDDNLNTLYENEQNFKSLINYLAILAIIIACLGLFGLASYAAQVRNKEIGIRKVLGATVSNIVMNLSADFLKLVAISFLVAVPVAYFLMREWLQGFAYKIDLSFEFFLLAGFITLILALGTVMYQSIKAALANPVDSLRSE